jgi:hypothetical protein
VTKRAETSPVTLGEAHEAMGRCRPAPGAPLDAWLAYHRRGRALYAEIADVDRFHHHEALYWAERERQSAVEIEARMAAARSAPLPRGSGSA